MMQVHRQMNFEFFNTKQSLSIHFCWQQILFLGGSAGKSSKSSKELILTHVMENINMFPKHPVII